MLRDRSHHPSGRLYAVLFLLFSMLLAAPGFAQLSTSEEDESPYLFAKEDADVRKVAEGKGWFQLHVYDAKSASRTPTSDLIFVTPAGIANAPLTEAEKAELAEDFGVKYDSRSLTKGTGFEPMPVPGSLDPQLDPMSAPTKSACPAGGPPAGGGDGGGGIIVIDQVQMKQIATMKALNPGHEADALRKGQEKSWFGWSDKTKTKTWNLVDTTIGDSFSLGGGFTGSYQVNLPFQSTGTAVLKYRVKKAFGVPYKFRFTSIRTHGSTQLAGNAELSATASLAYQWEKEWQVANPRIARIDFWVGVIPVWIDINLPTSVGLGLDAKVSATVSLDADFGASGTFDYTCTSEDCCGEDNFTDHFDTDGVNASLQAEIGAEANAKVMVRAELWDDSILYGEAGVKGFVNADIWGYYGNACGDADGDGQNETVRALTADAEAGYDWVFGIGGALAPDRDWTTTGDRYPLGFWDLLGEGGSTALSPMLLGPSSVNAGQTATYTARMRPCYPYTDAVNLSIGPGTWNGNLQIAKPKSANAAESSTTLSRAFTQGGTQNITLTATTDAKGRDLGTVTARNLNVVDTTPINPKRGLWYNPARSGHGISLYSNSFNQYVLTWYTYTAAGAPTWYISGAGTKVGNTWSQPLYRVTMGSNGTTSHTTVGSVTMSYTSPQNATFSWTLNGQSGSEPFQYFYGGYGRSGLWYPPSQSGWGLTVSDQNGTMVTTVTYYDGGGQPVWVQGVGSSTADSIIPLARYSSPDLCPSCGGNTSPTTTPAGSLRLRIPPGSLSGVLSTTITSPGATWYRNDLPISILAGS